MPLDEQIKAVCEQLISCKDEAEAAELCRLLKRLVHERVEETRLHVRILPLLAPNTNRKKAA
jgi:hypothetical protein